ncbi:hypothetical protein H6F89_04805 [Cyanobacteria bacterium FACHB-63]|nr:hypothetical protein [Cyanobacteria bacterium FACHB-63]
MSSSLGRLLKFSYLIHIPEQLLTIKDATLVKQTQDNCCWGDGGSNRNMLGKLLIELRAQLHGEIKKFV